MTTDLLERARRRRADLLRGVAVASAEPSPDCEISEKSEESQVAGGLISHNSLISQSISVQSGTHDPLLRARQRLRELRNDYHGANVERDDLDRRSEPPVTRTVGRPASDTDCEIGEKSEKRSVAPPASSLTADPFRAWRLRNAELLAAGDGGAGRDYGGYCAEHRRVLSYPEQKRGACSWCVPVDPEREPEYWASHWRRFTAKS